MSTARNKRGKRRAKKIGPPKKQNELQQSNTNKHKFIGPCKELIKQIISIDDSKPFHKLLATNHPLYKDYKVINPQPISFS